MHRVSFAQAGLRLAVLAALTVPLVVAAAPKPTDPKATAPASPQPKPKSNARNTAVTSHPKFRGWLNNVPDTGQFLADSVWLLRVGPRVTRVGDYVERWYATYPEDRSGQDSLGRLQFLETLTNKDVLGMAALSIERPSTFEDRSELRIARQRALANAVYRRYVRDSIVVAEKEIRDLWETYKWDQHVRHIMLADRNAAEMVRREIVSGRTPWSAAVKKYSLGDITKFPDGDMGWVERRRMDPDIGNVVFALKPGEISAPVRDNQGWHILQSLERKPKSPPAYNAVRSKLLEELRAERTTVRVHRIFDELRAQAGMQHDTANVLLACKQFRATMKLESAGFGASIQVDEHVPEFSPQDTARLLATWRDGGRYSLGDLLHAYSEVPPLLRPTLNMPEAVIAFIESSVLEPRLAEYGAQRGLESDSLVQVLIARKREELAVGHMYQDSVARFIWVSKQERQAYYEKHKAQFHTYAKVTFAAIARGSRAGADSVAAALTSGVAAAQILAADSAAGLKSGSIQVRSQAEGGSYHTALFEEMRKGDVQVRGPDREGYYAIIQVLDYDPGVQLSYDESAHMIDESLQNQKAEAALKALIARLRTRFHIESRPELLPHVAFRDPTIDD